MAEEELDDRRLDALIEEQEIDAQIERHEESYYGMHGPAAEHWARTHDSMSGFKGPWA